MRLGARKDGFVHVEPVLPPVGGQDEELRFVVGTACGDNEDRFSR